MQEFYHIIYILYGELQNLLLNALKYTKCRCIHNQDPQVSTGRELNQLVERSSKGKGVELQIVKRLCELLNAQVDIKSRPDRGTMVRGGCLSIPIPEQEATRFGQVVIRPYA